VKLRIHQLLSKLTKPPSPLIIVPSRNVLRPYDESARFKLINPSNAFIERNVITAD